MRQKGFAMPLVILGIVVLVVITAGTFYASKILTPTDIVPAITTTQLPFGIDTNKEVECKAKGGEWTTTGISLSPVCVMKTKDGGKVCKDQSDCEGGCMSPDGSKEGDNVIGKCSEYNSVKGCVALVEHGKVNPTVCLD